VIGADGSQVGILPTFEAMKLAEEQGLELVEVNPRAAPPVCRIMDFGKFKYENSKKEKASRKHQSTVVVKEVKFRPKTDIHDLEFKVKHIRRFLQEGNKCRLVIVFRGREIVHPETGQAMLDSVMKALGDAAIVEQRAAMEGRRMVLTIGPKMGVIRPNPAPGASPSGPGGGAAGEGGPPSSAPPAPRPAPAARPAGAAPGAAAAAPAPGAAPAPKPVAAAAPPAGPGASGGGGPAGPTSSTASGGGAGRTPSPVSAPAEGGGSKVAASSPKAKA
jgi:translation initiation factor IF-3